MTDEIEQAEKDLRYVDDIVTRLLAIAYPTAEDLEDACAEIVRKAIQLDVLRAQKELWRDIAIQAQDEVDALVEQLCQKVLRCDCS